MLAASEWAQSHINFLVVPNAYGGQPQVQILRPTIIDVQVTAQSVPAVLGAQNATAESVEGCESAQTAATSTSIQATATEGTAMSVCADGSKDVSDDLGCIEDESGRGAAVSNDTADTRGEPHVSANKGRRHSPKAHLDVENPRWWVGGWVGHSRLLAHCSHARSRVTAFVIFVFSCFARPPKHSRHRETLCTKDADQSSV